MRIHVSLAFIGLVLATTLGTVVANQSTSASKPEAQQEMAYRGSGRFGL
jgi:hypothetical protein